jgi:predicted RND superfamily exporter protein
MQPWALRFSRFFIRHRHINLALILAATVFFGYHAAQLQVFSQFIDLLPRNHPYIEVYEKYNRQYGGANVVYAALIARDGKNVYDERFLEKVYGFTDQIDKIEGVDHGQIQSVTHISVRDQRIDREGVLSTPQMVGSEAIVLLEAQFHTRRLLRYARSVGAEQPGDLPGLIALAGRIRTGLQDQLEPYGAKPVSQIDPAAAEQVRSARRLAAEVDLLLLRLEKLPPGYALEGESLVHPQGGLLPPGMLDGLSDRIHQSRYVFGRLISRDDSAALISAGFVEGRLDYRLIFDELYALKAELEADGTIEIYLTGQPVLVGWTFAFLGEIALVLGCSILVLVILPWLYFRHWYGIALPLSGATMSAIWGLGYTSLMGYQLEPLVLVIPMLITARAVSHSVQFVERFYEEYERLKDKEEAVVSSMAELLLPGGLGIVTDAIGILVIYVSSIALMKKVALIGTVWALSILVTEMLLNRLMIMYFPAPKQTEHYVPKPIAAILHRIAMLATNLQASRAIAAVWIAIVVGSSFVALKVGIGEGRPGTPILYPDHEFNQATGVIASKFYGADELTMVVETELEGGVHRPEVMAEIEAFQRYMEADPKVGGSVSIVDFMKQINRVYHNADPRWSLVPYRAEEIGGLLYLYEASAPDPRVLQPVRDATAQTAAVRLFYADHQGTTIRAAVERARAFIAARPGGPIAVRAVTPEGDWRARLHWWLGPLIPPREPELTVLVRGDDGGYARQAVQAPGRIEPAPEDSSKRILTLPRITKPLHKNLTSAGYDSVQKLADADIEELAKIDGFDLVTAYALIQAAELDRRSYRVVQEWQDDGEGVAAQLRKRGLYEPYELWVRYQSDDWIRRESGEWANGASWALASGLMGVLAASNDEVEGSNNATLIASFSVTFLMILIAYRSLSVAALLCISLGTATLISLAYMYFAGIGFDVNTLPVQALGVGVGVDYALYIMDRVVRERQRGHSRAESLQIAIQTTGMAVFFTGTTLVGGIIFWFFLSSLRFSADMSLLLSIILIGNLIGAVLLVPSLATLFDLRFALGGQSAAPPLPEGDRHEGTRPGPGTVPDPRSV